MPKRTVGTASASTGPTSSSPNGASSPVSTTAASSARAPRPTPTRANSDHPGAPLPGIWGVSPKPVLPGGAGARPCRGGRGVSPQVVSFSNPGGAGVSPTPHQTGILTEAKSPMVLETVKAEISAELDESRGDLEQAVSRLIRKKPWQPYLDAPLGFRNHWYPALFSHELGEGEVKGEIVLGERVVLKRVDGQVYALEDRCAHRGVKMSARPECYTKNTLTCWYHGFTYNVTNGQLETIITQPTSPMKVTLQTYPVAERN